MLTGRSLTFPGRSFAFAGRSLMFPGRSFAFAFTGLGLIFAGRSIPFYLRLLLSKAIDFAVTDLYCGEFGRRIGVMEKN